MRKATKFDVELWIKTISTGEFHYKEIMDGQIDPTSFGNLRKIMHGLCACDNPLCEPVGRRDGYYRVIQNRVEPIDFSGVKGKRDFPVVLPFDLRKYVFIYPQTVGIVAGSKSSGKTGFLYRLIQMNMNHLNVVLLSNLEGGREQIYDRFLAMGVNLAKAPKFIYPVSENFHDYIKQSNTLYVVDYIDAPEGTDFYLIGAAISKIRKKLGENSVAFIGLQKPYGRDTAFGGEQTLKDAALYIALDNSKLKIVDAKVPADKKIHPKNMSFTFTYDEEGTKFDNIQPYYGL